MTITGHEVEIDIEYNELSEESKWDISQTIAQSILDGDDSGTETTPGGDKYNWKIETPKSYLDEKIDTLIETEEVVFEHQQKVFTIFRNSNAEYEYNIYSSRDIIDADMLEPLDGGVCTGSATDAVYMAIEV